MKSNTDNRQFRLNLLQVLLAVVFTTVLAQPIALNAQSVTQTTRKVEATRSPVASGHIQANGVNYYYEIHGEGDPLLLLHGGLGSIDMFDPILPMLTAERQVIGVDLHGHGRTQLGDRPFSIPEIGADMAVILQELGYDQVDVLGYSLGGGVAFQFAVQHPEMVRRLALISAGFSRDGFYPEILAQQAQVSGNAAEMMKDTPMYKSYAAIAPDPGEFPELLDQIGAYMRKPFDFSEEVKSLDMPVMIVFGDSDMYQPEHMVEFYKLLGGGRQDAGWMGEHMSQNRLAILPGLTHYDIFMAPEMVRTVLPFLEGQIARKSWNEQVEATRQ